MNEHDVKQLLADIVDPGLGQTLSTLQSIKEIQINAIKKHISVKVAVSKENGSEQLTLQTNIVNRLKEAGYQTVGLRFTALDPSIIHQFKVEKEKPLKDTTFIAIASGKGGVGKSTVTVNVAVALARLGKKVGIMDADIYGFSVPELLNSKEKPKLEGNDIVPVTAHGVQMISMSYFVEEHKPVVWRGPMLGKMLQHFFSEVKWDNLDYLLIDLPPGTGDVALDIHKLMPEVKEIIVTTPHPAAATVASRAGAMAKQTNHQVLGIIENMSYFKSEKTGEVAYIFGQGGGEKVASILEVPLLAKVPLQPNAVEDNHIETAIYAESHATSAIFKQVAESIIKEASVESF